MIDSLCSPIKIEGSNSNNNNNDDDDDDNNLAAVMMLEVAVEPTSEYTK